MYQECKEVYLCEARHQTARLTSEDTSKASTVKNPTKDVSHA